MRYGFNIFIRYSIGYRFFREVISRILAFIRFTLSLGTLIFGSILNVKLKPRNFLRQGRSTVDLSRLTFSFNLSSINDVTEFMTRRPALRVFTKIWGSRPLEPPQVVPLRTGREPLSSSGSRYSAIGLIPNSQCLKSLGFCFAILPMKCSALLL